MSDRDMLNVDDYMLGDFFDDEANAKALVPHSREAEEAVLACILIDPALYRDVSEILTWDDFYIHRHKWIFQTLTALSEQGMAVDILTVANELQKNSQLDEIGGASYLTSLLNQAPATYNAESYARIVEGHALRRKWADKANQVAQIAYDTQLSIDDASTKVEELLAENVTTSKRTWQTAEEAALDMLARVTGGAPVAVKTHIPDLDKLIGGLPISYLTLLMGDASLGKTALLYQISQQVNFNNTPALYITLEEANWRMVSRTVFTNAEVDKKDWRAGSLTQADMQKLERHTTSYIQSHGNMYFDQKSRTVAQIQRSVRQIGAKLVVVDDLRHVRLDNHKYNASDTSILLDVAGRLKEIAFDEECAMVAIHHVTAEEAAKFWGDKGQKPTSNDPPSIDSIAWARDLRYLIDQWLFMVPDCGAIKDADVLKIILWLMKDKETARFVSTDVLYDRKAQWFYDYTNKPLGMYANQIYKP